MGGSEPGGEALPFAPPIWATSTYRYADTAALERGLRGELPFYARWENPTVREVERRLAGLYGAEEALLFGSGMAAVSAALMTGLAGGKRLLCQAEVYGGTRGLVEEVLRPWGAEVTWVPIDRWGEVLAAEAVALARGEVGPGGLRPPVGVVWVETPVNPTLQLVDLEAVGAGARRLGALLVVDDTFAPPVLQRSLALGADVAVASATKYLGGHHDLLGGLVAGGRAFLARVAAHRKYTGGVLDPFQAFLLGRGLHTLELRVARQAESALALARWLAGHPRVAAVAYPGLEDHPDRALARRQLPRGAGGMLSFEVRGGREAAVAVVDRLRVIALAASLGGVESSACMPVNTSHAALAPAERAALGIADGLVRLSVGVEPEDALRADLAQALG